MYQQHALSKSFYQHDIHYEGLVNLLKTEHVQRKLSEERFNQLKIQVKKILLHNKELERAINTNIDEEKKREIEVGDSKASLALISDLVKNEDMDEESTLNEIEKVLSFYYQCDRVS